MFKRMVRILPALCLATGIASAAQSPFIGEWKLDPSKSRMPDEMKVKSEGGNKYTFNFGGVAETIVVDGSDQPGGYGGTVLSVKAEAPDTWIVKRKKDGRLLLEARWKLSEDGSALTDYFREFDSDGAVFNTDYFYQRAGEGSGFAGDWQSTKETMNSPFPVEVKEFQSDGLSFVDPVAQRTINLKPDGAEHPRDQVPTAGRGASSSLQRVGDRTLVITDKRDGKVTDTEEFRLSPDLKALTMTVHIAGRDKPYVLIFERK